MSVVVYISGGLRRSVLVTTLAALVAVAGCSTSAARTAAVDREAPVQQDPALSKPHGAPVPPDWSGPVTMARLIATAQATHPTHDVIAASRAAAAAHVRQAGAWDNPELELSYGRTRPRLEGLERDTPYGGSLSQRLAWWGTRNARIEAARARLGVVEAENRMAAAALQADVRRAAIVYAAALDAAAQAEDDARIAGELATQTATRLDAGEADRATLARARLEAATATVHHHARRREVDQALAVLRTWCDPALPTGLVIVDALETPKLDGIPLGATAGHPQLAALAQAIGSTQATVAAERNARVPDLTVGVFADREDDKDTYGVTVGVELPLWNRNDARVAEAEAEHAQARAAARQEHLRLQRDLADAVGALQAAQGEVQALSEQAMPTADEAIRLRTTAYQAGDASLADLLEGRRAANAVRAELRDARRRAALALVDLGLAVGDASLGVSPAVAPPSP